MPKYNKVFSGCFWGFKHWNLDKRMVSFDTDFMYIVAITLMNATTSCNAQPQWSVCSLAYFSHASLMRLAYISILSTKWRRRLIQKVYTATSDPDVQDGCWSINTQTWLFARVECTRGCLLEAIQYMHMVCITAILITILTITIS